jgi:glycosyltransferase involved in cell wall biosynthesis
MRNGKIITARLWPNFSGGIPSVAPVILGINPQKYETICIYLAKNSSSSNIFEQKGKKVFYITQKSKPPAFSLAVFSKLTKILRTEGVDILHCHKHISTFYGTIAAKMANVPVVLTHVHGMGRTRNLKRKIHNRFLFSRLDRIFAVGEAVREDILQSNPAVKPEKVINTGNSIDYNYFSSRVYNKQTVCKKFGIPENSFVFGTAGRLAPTKGLRYLVRAFAQIKKQLHNVELLIAGTGELKGRLEKRTVKLGCNNSVHFLGHVENMPEFYSAIDVFVLPSVAEGLPRVIIEAMAAGILCVATDAGGIPEILDNGRCGLLVPPKDTNALAEAMLKVVNMPQQEKSAVISEAKEHIKKNYNHDVMIKKTEKIYDTLAKEKLERMR